MCLVSLDESTFYQFLSISQEVQQWHGKHDQLSTLEKRPEYCEGWKMLYRQCMGNSR